MSDQNPFNDRTTMRRSDRGITDPVWIREFLLGAPVGTVSTVVGGQPFHNINLFVYDARSHAIYLHTAGSGRLRSNVESCDRVCFSTYRMGRLLPADTAREFSVEYDSVILFGRCTILTDMMIARDIMQMLMDKYFAHLKPDEHYRPISQTEIEEITVFKIDIDSWSAKHKSVASDFPGAFRLGESHDIR